MEREAIRKFLESDSPQARMLKDAFRKGLIGNAAELGPPEPGEKIALVIGPSTDIIGSKQVTCSCGQKGWISPSSQELMVEKGPENFEFMCTFCLPGKVEEMKKEQKETNQ
jgi:hypothetical protein